MYVRVRVRVFGSCVRARAWICLADAHVCGRLSQQLAHCVKVAVALTMSLIVEPWHLHFVLHTATFIKNWYDLPVDLRAIWLAHIHRDASQRLIQRGELFSLRFILHNV